MCKRLLDMGVVSYTVLTRESRSVTTTAFNGESHSIAAVYHLVDAEKEETATEEGEQNNRVPAWGFS
jgi:hypothetical protein